MKNITTYLTLILFLIVILCTGCSKISSYQRSIYDDNTKIVAKADSYFFKRRTGKTDNNELSIRFEDFTGKQKIWEIEAKENSAFLIDCNTEISNGEFKICLINEEKEVINIAEGNKAEKLTIDIKKGVSFITIVGNEAKGKLDLTLTENDKIYASQIEK